VSSIHLWPDTPQAELENAWAAQGARLIGGVDEAGRGPIAGPIVIGGVLLDPDDYPDGLADSKKLTARRRDELADAIRETAICAFVIIRTAEEIDQVGVQAANIEGLKEAAGRLAEHGADVVLCDWYDIGTEARAGENTVPVASYPKGDGRSLNVAAASILAKTTRDQMMEAYDETYPGYGFAKHKGYGTAAHRAAIETHGLTPIHRRSFCRRYLDEADAA